MGGTPFLAMHMYAPMSNLETLLRCKMGPSTWGTIK